MKEEVFTFNKNFSPRKNNKSVFLPSVGAIGAATNYSIERIRNIISGGDEIECRELSRYFYRYSGVYGNTIDYLSSLLMNCFVVLPNIEGETIKSDKNFLKNYFRAVSFVDALDLKTILPFITYIILRDGIFYGLLLEENNNFVIVNLPSEYCRTRYKNYFNVQVLEFNLEYFDTFCKEEDKLSALESFPSFIQKSYKQFLDGKITKWLKIPDLMGIALYYNTKIPLKLSSIPSILGYDDAQDREAVKDENELDKVVVQELPLNNADRPAFKNSEIDDMHAGLDSMLNNTNCMGITTHAKVYALDFKNNSTSTHNTLIRYKTAAYDSLGSTSELYNATTATGIKMSVNRDTAIMMSLSQIYVAWLNCQLVARFIAPSYYFSVTMLPVSHFNRKEMINEYLKMAQYGYSKFFLAAASGISQNALVPLSILENELLALNDILQPLSSSHTQSNNKNEEPNNSDSINDEGGRPTKSIEEKADTTLGSAKGEGQE